MSEKLKRPKATLELDGVEYVLQHPGNRAWLTHYQKSMSGDEPDVVAFLDWCFEHVVHPKKSPKLSLDTLQIGGQQMWIPLLLAFLVRGELEAGRAWKDFESSGLVIAKEEGNGKGEGRRGEKLDAVDGGPGGGDDG